MHEFSLASNIIEIVTETAEQNQLKTITELVLEIGSLSGVEISALDMAMESLQPGTVLEHATITKDLVKAEAKCLECGKEFVPDDFFCACPHCGSFRHEVLQGKELKVKTIIGE